MLNLGVDQAINNVLFYRPEQGGLSREWLLPVQGFQGYTAYAQHSPNWSK